MKTMKYKTVRAALLVLGCLAVVAPAAAELDSHLPAETLVYLQWSGRSLTFDGSKFGQMILDPEVQKLVDFFRGTVEENIGDGQGRAMFQKAWSCARIAWEHPVAVGMYDIHKKGASAAFLIDLGEDKAAFEKEFQALIDSLPRQEGQELAAVPAGGGSYTLLPGPAAKKLEPAFGYRGNVFFFTIGSGQAKALLERKAETSLQANKKYQECMKAVGGESVQFTIYADVQAVVAQIEAAVADPAPETAPAEPTTQPAVSPAQRITQALGVDKIQALAGTVRVVDKGMYTKVRLFAPAPHQGLLLPLAGATLSDADLAGVPGDVDLAIAANISPKAVYDEFRRVLKDIDPKMDVMADGVVTSLENHWKFSLEKDLLASLGDTWVYSVSPSQGGPIVGSMISVEVTDPEKLQTFINNLERTLLPPASDAPPTTQPAYYRPRPQPRIEIMNVGDTKIHYLRVPDIWAGVAFLPAWAVQNNRLYFALWPQVIASALQNTTEPLTQRPEYQELRKRFNPNASAMVYVNTPEIMKKLYPLQLVGGTVLMNAVAAKTGTNLPVPLWPGSLNSVLQFLMPQMNVISHDADGITFEGYGTCPSILPAAPVVIGAGVAAVIPARLHAGDNTQQVASMSNLRQIGLACQAYAIDHNEQLPSSLDELSDYLEYSSGTMRVLINPTGGKPSPVWNAEQKKIEGPVDYVLVDLSNRKISEITSPMEVILVYENPVNYQNRGTNVGFADGHVEWVTMARFNTLLQQAKELSEKAPAKEKSDF